MSNIFFKYIAILICLSFLIGCKEEKLELNKNEDFPFHKGNFWNYNVDHYYIYDSAIVNGVSMLDTFMTRKIEIYIEDLVDIDGVSNFQVQCRKPSQGSTSYSYYTNNSEGLKYTSGPGWGIFSAEHLFPMHVDKKGWKPVKNIKQSDNSVETNNEFILKYPLFVGSEWITQEYYNEDHPEFKAKVIGKEIVNLSDQQFDCFKIKIQYFENDSSYLLDFIDNDYGLIKREIKFYDYEMTLKKEDTSQFNNYIIIGTYKIDVEQYWELTDFHVER